MRALVDGGADGVIVEGAVRLQICLSIGDAVLLQGAFALPNADDFLQSIIGGAHWGEQFISGQEIGRQGHCQGVGAAGDLGADQGSLRVEHIGIDPLQIVPALIIIAVTGGSGKVRGIDPVFLHGGQDLALVVLRGLIDCVKPLPQSTKNGFSILINSRTHAQLLIHRFHFHLINLVFGIFCTKKVL